VLEEFWDQAPRKLIFIQDNERVAIIRPSDKLCVFGSIKETRTNGC
jgi:hypothetical protein